MSGRSRANAGGLSSGLARRAPAAVTPGEMRAALVDLGRQLAAWRDAAGLTQVQLAERMFYSRSSVATVEIGTQKMTAAFWQRADRVLDAGGVLVKAFELVDDLSRECQRRATLARAVHRDAGRSKPPGTDLAGPASAGQATPAPQCLCPATVGVWGTREARALRIALRMPMRVYAAFLGVDVNTVSGWENQRAQRPLRLSSQQILDQALALADHDTRARFRQVLDLPADHPLPT